MSNERGLIYTEPYDIDPGRERELAQQVGLSSCLGKERVGLKGGLGGD
jgi:hypothetical protein